MYHSITFERPGVDPRYGYLTPKNTWDDWHIIPSQRPSIQPPEEKTNYIDVPGRNGVLDLSTALTGYPVYKNRTGTIEFIFMPGYKPWNMLYAEVMNYLNGQILNVYLEDDPGWYYHGKFQVSKWDSKNDGTGSRITLEYDLDPYKISEYGSTDSQLWDNFNLVDGIDYGKLCNPFELNSYIQIENMRPFYPKVEVSNKNSTNKIQVTMRYFESYKKDYFITQNGIWTCPDIFVGGAIYMDEVNSDNNPIPPIQKTATVKLIFTPERF